MLLLSFTRFWEREGGKSPVEWSPIPSPLLVTLEVLQTGSLTAQRAGSMPNRFGLPILYRETPFRALGCRVAILTPSSRQILGEIYKNVAQDIETH